MFRGGGSAQRALVRHSKSLLEFNFSTIERAWRTGVLWGIADADINQRQHMQYDRAAVDSLCESSRSLQRRQTTFDNCPNGGIRIGDIVMGFLKQSLSYLNASHIDVCGGVPL